MKKTCGSEEQSKLRNWLKYATDLPYNRIKEIRYSKISEFLKSVSIKLDKELYGMNKVKEQILIFLNTRLSNPEMKGCSLGFKGPPGVGKTTIARILAKVMEWPFEQISFGGVSNADFLKGHDFTYVGSRPGEIVRCLSRMKYKNGILFFDEFEKVADNKPILSTLLHITDFQQNHEFTDNYLADLKIDLSRLWFIYSMNEYPKDSALRDRIYIIELDGYKTDEKVKILKDYVLPKFLKNIGLKEDDIIIDENVSKYIIEKYDKDYKGIRNLENIMKEIVQKIHFIVNNFEEMNTYSCLTFKCKEKLKFPLNLTIKLLEEIFKKENNTPFGDPPFGMYM